MTRKPRDPAWLPIPTEAADAEAFQALSKGVANADQQTRCLDWIVKQAAATYELSFRSDSDGGDRETAFAEGRRFVGLQVVKLVNASPALIAQLRGK